MKWSEAERQLEQVVMDAFRRSSVPFDLSDLHAMTLVEDLASWVNERFGLESDSAAKGGE